MAGGQRTQLPYFSIAAEMYRGFLDLGEALQEIGSAAVAGREDVVAEGQLMVAEAKTLYIDLQTSLRRTAAATTTANASANVNANLNAGFRSTVDSSNAASQSTGSEHVCPISFVAGGTNCSVADASQSLNLQSRENEPWRTWSAQNPCTYRPRLCTDAHDHTTTH